MEMFVNKWWIMFVYIDAWKQSWCSMYMYVINSGNHLSMHALCIQKVVPIEENAPPALTMASQKATEVTGATSLLSTSIF